MKTLLQPQFADFYFFPPSQQVGTRFCIGVRRRSNAAFTASRLSSAPLPATAHLVSACFSLRCSPRLFLNKLSFFFLPCCLLLALSSFPFALPPTPPYGEGLILKLGSHGYVEENLMRRRNKGASSVRDIKDKHSVCLRPGEERKIRLLLYLF